MREENDVMGDAIINTRVTKEFKNKFMDETHFRCISASKLIRVFLQKFVNDPDTTLERLFEE